MGEQKNTVNGKSIDFIEVQTDSRLLHTPQTFIYKQIQKLKEEGIN